MSPWSRIPRALGFLGAFLRAAGRRFFEDRCPEIAAGLAYTTLLAMVPLVTVAVAIAAAFPTFSQLTTAFKVLYESSTFGTRGG